MALLDSRVPATAFTDQCARAAVFGLDCARRIRNELAQAANPRGVRLEGTRPMRFLHSIKLRTTAVLIAVLGAILLFHARYVMPRIKAQDILNATRYQSALASQIAQDLDATFRAAIGELEALAHLPDIASLDPRRINAVLDQMNRVTTHFNYFFVTDSAGVWIAYPTRPELVGQAIPEENMAWVREMFREHRTVFLDVVRSLVNTLVSGFGTPILDTQGRPVAALRGVMVVSDKNRARELVARTRMGERGYAYIVSGSGHLIAHPSQRPEVTTFDATDWSYLPPVQRVRTGETGLIEYPFEGETWVASYCPISCTGWGVVVQQPKADIVSSAERDANLLWRFLVLAFLVSAVLVAGVIQVTLQPLGRLVRRLASGAPPVVGNYPKDEIGQLAREFAGLYTDLYNSQEALKESREDYRRLSEALEERVRARTVQLEAANREIASFAYSVSHDLRAPLRHIDGFSKILLEDYDPELDERGRDYLNRVRTASQRMGDLIDALLRLSRLTRGEVNLEPMDLTQMVREVAAELHARAPDRKVEWIIGEDLTICGDRTLVRVVLENLLGNAWKFTGGHAAARIEVGATAHAGETVYHVRDDGAGFDMAYADQLFAPFQRLHRPEEFPGTGIGLATVQRIIARHGGRIWAEAAVEKGATFYFTLGTGDPQTGCLEGQPAAP
jgi:signal transduction histidine kinase